MLLLLLLLSSALLGCNAGPNRDWEAAPSLQNGETLYACVGESVTFDWRLNPKGSLVNVEEIQFQHQNKADMMSSNNNSNPDSLAFIIFSDNRPERVLIPQDPKYAGRVEVNRRVMTIKSLKVADSGLYFMVIEGHDRKLDTKKTITSTVTLVVADDIMTTDKGLTISESVDAYFNKTTGRHHKVLECGDFTYNTTPPFDVSWKVPGMSTPRSTEYSVIDGRFRLVLPLRMRTGSYGCSVTKDNAARACAKALVNSDIRLDATEMRFWLLGKDLARSQTRIKSNTADTAKGQSSNTAQIDSLRQQLTALDNKLATKDAQLDKLIAQLATKDVQLTNKTAELVTEMRRQKDKVDALEEKVARSQDFFATDLYDDTLYSWATLRFKDVKHGHESYNSSSGQFTTKYSGTYLVTFMMSVKTKSRSPVYAHAYLFVNDVYYLRCGTFVGDIDVQSATLTAVLALQKGQTLDIRTGSISFDIASDAKEPIFSVALIHSA